MADELWVREGLPKHLADYDFKDVYVVPIMKTAPVLDGHVDEDEWKCAVGFDGLSHQGKLEERRARAYIGATRTHIYVGIITEMPPEGELIADRKVRTANLVWDDSVEVWVNATPESETYVSYQMLANSLGYECYQPSAIGNVPREEYYGWNGEYRIVNGFHDGFWHCEIEIATDRVEKGRLATEGKWGLNVCRNWKMPWTFSNLGNRAYTADEDIVFQFVEDGAAAIQVKHAKDPTTKDVKATMSIYNPGTKTLDLSAHFHLKRNLMPDVGVSEDITVAPGETKEISFADHDMVSNKFTLLTMVSEKDGPFVYTRHYLWGPPRENRWESVSRDLIPVDFEFAYYPSANKMRVMADITSLSEDARLERIDFEIRKKGGETVKAFSIASSEFKGQTKEVRFDLPPLDGDYEVVSQPVGRGIPEEPLVKEFIRYKYEWEGLGLGKSRKVYHPFTPIRVEGSTLHTAMKEYDMNGLGLMDSVRTMDQMKIGVEDVLAGPMTYKAIVAGKSVTPTDAKLSILDVADDVVTGQSSAKLGEIDLDTRCTLDYDGTMRIDLTLSSETATDIESMDLEIPFAAEVSKMMHAMTDGIRYPIVTGPIPEGTGVVWTARDIIPNDMPHGFCTYIFIGDAQRGLCWFAENDFGWSWDSEKPNLELIRNDDGTLTMKVHFVNKPLVVSEPRTITFGLLGAPIKPRLEGSRHKFYTDNYSILGCDRHWYALGICGSVYPAGRDMKLWEAIRKANKKAFTDSEIEEFIAYGRKHFEPYGWDHHTAEFVDLASRNLKNRVGTTMVFYYNRSSSPVYDEYHTFADEWGMEDFNSRASRAPYEAKIVPSESYFDFALYWYGRSFDIAGNTGVYVDNNYFCACRNTEMTAAYTKDDGTIMPSSGIWGLRELAKRTFTYLNERGMFPFNMNHMTTTQILPINAFYTVQYDWELHLGEGDCHDRYSAEYLQLVSNGDHAGTWPIVLHDQGKLEYDEWTLRTFEGVCTTHELIIDRYVWHHEPVRADSPELPLHRKLRMPICDIVQQPGCDVFRYWDKRPQPVTATNNPLLRTIIYSVKGKEAIVAVSNFDTKNDTAVLKIDAAALGFDDGYKAVEMESGEEVDVSKDEITVPLRKHDYRQFRLVAK